MGGRKSYDSKRVTGNSKPVNNNKKSLDKSIKEKKPLDIAYNSAKLSIENQKQSKELFSFLSLSKYVVNEDKLKEKQPTEQKDIKSILDKYSTKNKPITQKEKDLLQKSLNRSRRVKK